MDTERVFIFAVRNRAWPLSLKKKEKSARTLLSLVFSNHPLFKICTSHLVIFNIKQNKWECEKNLIMSQLLRLFVLPSPSRATQPLPEGSTWQLVERLPCPYAAAPECRVCQPHEGGSSPMWCRHHSHITGWLVFSSLSDGKSLRVGPFWFSTHTDTRPTHVTWSSPFLLYLPWSGWTQSGFVSGTCVPLVQNCHLPIPATATGGHIYFINSPTYCYLWSFWNWATIFFLGKYFSMNL